MTENKRFDCTYYDDGTGSIYDKEKNEYYFDCDLDEIEEVLNELNDENKELRILVDSLKQQNKKFKGRLNDLGVEYYD